MNKFGCASATRLLKIKSSKESIMKNQIRYVNMVFLLIASLSVSAFAVVDTRLTLVSNTHNTGPGQGTVVVAIEAISTSGSPEIRVFQNSLQMAVSLNDQYVSHSYNHILFNVSGMAYAFSESNNFDLGRLSFRYVRNPGATYQTIGPGWTTVAELSIVYNMTNTTGTVCWYEASPPWPYYVEDSNDTDITGSKGSWSGDISLPVELSVFTATFVSEKVVELFWRTESELHCAGFHIWRSENKEGTFKKITSEIIPGYGNSSTGHEYTFFDEDLHSGLMYWYILEEVAINGISTFYDPIAANPSLVPENCMLSQNYPNPFNPQTKIRYEISKSIHVRLIIYNLLGEEIITLVNEMQKADIYTNWKLAMRFTSKK
jgi:hypothetical protein